MTDVQPKLIRDALLGLEHSGSESQIYSASFAVPDILIGSSRGLNGSGLSFGVSQLDIGSNSLAQDAYLGILDEASTLNLIDEQTLSRLASYSGVERPDLNQDLYPKFQSDRAVLSDEIFSQGFARDLIDHFDMRYIEENLAPEINRFLSAVQDKWGTDTVFNTGHSDYPTALAAIISIANRTGDLRGSDQYFLENKPTDLLAVEVRYQSLTGLGDHWNLVEIGGALVFLEGDQCFLAGTMINTWQDTSENRNASWNSNRVHDESSHVQRKPIEDIVEGELVVSFDKKGGTVPRVVTNIFSNDAAIVLDFFGTGVTPGHVYYRADSDAPESFETLIDILRGDGIVQQSDGRNIRAATGQAVDSPHDSLIHCVVGPLGSDGRVLPTEQGRLRLGTRFISDDGKDFCIADVIEAVGGHLTEDGLVRLEPDGEALPFHWNFSEDLPKSEDYILKRSGVTLADIYEANEWDEKRPKLPGPKLGLKKPPSTKSNHLH